MKKKLKLKTGVYYFLGAIILISLAIYYGYTKYQEYEYKKSYEYKFIEKGYSLEDYQKIKDLDNKNLEFLLSIRQNNQILDLINEKYFIPDKLESYYNYLEKHPKEDIKKIVAIINAKVDNEYYSLDLQTDLDKEYAIIVNKYYQINKEYTPNDLVPVSMDYSWGEYGSIVVRQVVMDNFLDMWQSANQEGIYLMISSAYRSYADQETVYNNYKDHQGEAYADSIAARPGYSEHQTGLSIDVFSKTNSNRNTFKDSEAAKWLANNAYKFGFILRYPSDKVDLTGYNYEAWHYRYVGKDIAKYIYENDITFEEYYAYFLENS